MSRLIWSPGALADVQRLYRFLASKNPAAATAAVKMIRDGVRSIASHSASGRPIEDMDPAYREWLIGFGESGYVVLYRLEDDTTMILAVRHQREAGYS